MARREDRPECVLAAIEPAACPEGPVLEPLEAPDPRTQQCFSGWETPLAPWGGFRLESGLAVVDDQGRPVLEWTLGGGERAVVAGPSHARDYRVVAEVKPIDTAAPAHVDRADCSEATIGIVFRVRTSRQYYCFGVEGCRRVVLYRRCDDEWLALAQQDVELPEGYVTLEVALDGDGIRCRCETLGVEFFRTDTAFREGKAGLRGIGRARVASARITQTPSQQARDTRRRRALANEERARGQDIADPVLVRTLDLGELGGTPQFMDFARAGRYDMLIAGKSLRAMTTDGETLWEAPVQLDGVVFSAGHSENGRLIYGLAGERQKEDLVGVTGRAGAFVVSDEMCIIRGDDGAVVARGKVPELDDAVRRVDFSPASGNLSGDGGFDIVVREWRRDAGHGGFHLWAFDQDLNLLWHQRVETPYGHHWAVQLYDVDGDGRDEVLAGGTLFDADGRVVWVHDLASEMAEIAGAHHYDAVALGAFAGDEAVDPVAFLLGGSAGVYVVDGLTGRTRMVHRVGHAQGRFVGAVRGDLPGQQVLVACRWGNMGILTLFSGRGDRLWSIQPDYLGQGTLPVAWGAERLIWANTSGPVQAFYDGYGRRVKELPELRRLWGHRMRRDVQTFAARMGDEPTDLLCLTVEGMLYAFGPEGCERAAGI